MRKPLHLRRWVGGVMIIAAVVMLLAGETVLRDRISGAGFVLYWLTCFLFTGAALLLGLFDAMLVRRKFQRERKALLDATVEELRQDLENQRRAQSQGDNHHEARFRH